MNLTVTAASEYVLRLLGRYTRGSVHSVYRKTINLTFEGQLVALQAKGSPLSPISLILPLTEEEMASLSVEAGMDAALNSSSLRLSRECTLFFGQVIPRDLKLKRELRREQLVFLEGELDSVISSCFRGSFEQLFSRSRKGGQIPFLDVAGEHLTAGSRALEAGLWEEAAGRLGRLIVLGMGLTPGGDDFLCGVMAGFILCGQTDHPFASALREYVKLHLTDTNEISAAFLRCALDGQFSQAVNSLSTLPLRKEILADFSAIGHSSGMDTLCGIIYLLKNRQMLKL